MKLDRVLNYPRAFSSALISAVRLGMPPGDLARYLWAYSKNARSQLGFREAFDVNKVNSFRTNRGAVFFRDNRSDPATLPEIIENQYGFGPVKGGGCMVDVGACHGMASFTFHAFNPKARIFCFEPIRESFRVIGFNCPTAKRYNAWIGEKEGRKKAYVHPINNMGLRDKEKGCVEREVKVEPLDNYADEFGEISMLKIDVEGSELEVLRGAKRVLENTREVRMETHSDKLHRDSISFLSGHGFEIWKERFKGSIGYVFARR
jgi:FkbM family methyltransferase